MFILKNTANLFGTDWIALFDLWDLPINSFCCKINIVCSRVNMATTKFKE